VTSTCPSVTIQQMTLELSGDLVVLADSVNVVNGLKVRSADGAAHRLILGSPVRRAGHQGRHR